MGDDGKTCAEAVGSGIALAIDATFDLAVDLATTLAVVKGLDLTGQSASQTV